MCSQEPLFTFSSTVYRFCSCLCSSKDTFKSHITMTDAQSSITDHGCDAVLDASQDSTCTSKSSTNTPPFLQIKVNSVLRFVQFAPISNSL